MTTRMVFPDGAWDDIRKQLFDPTVGYGGSDWGRDVLAPWTAANLPILDALRQLGRPQMAAIALDAGDLWTLYAISRVAELLILPHQPPSRDPDEPTDWLPRTAYQQFLTAVGGTFPRVESFHPFLHEIAMVEPADDPTTSPAPTGLWWPGCMIGSLVLVRAGVTVRAGTEQLDPAVAAGSTLYWAWRRRYRPTADRSHGWGNNSQWRTGFRRDYWLPDRLAYNVDAALDPTPEHPGGMPYNRDLDLLRHRCSTLTDHGDEQQVWHNHHTEPVPGWGTVPATIDAVAEIAAGLEHLDTVTGVWEVADRRLAAGDAVFVADLAVALWKRYQAAPAPPWQYRSVLDHLVRVLALTGGIRTIEQAVRIVTITGDQKQQRYVASLLAAGQSPQDLTVVFDHSDSATALQDFRAYLIHELVLRGVAVHKIPAMARWAGMPAHRGDHPFRQLPLSLTPLEGTPPLPRYSTRGTTYNKGRGARDGTAVPSGNDGAPVPSWRETTTPAVAAEIAAAVTNWVQESNGRCEARTYELAEALGADTLAGTLAGLGLQCLHGTLPELVTCTPEQVWQILFEAASNGGAYNTGESGAGGRQSAWRSVAALTGCAATTPVAKVETRARECAWYTVATTTDWFEQVGWDFALVAVTPDRRHLAVLAATDSD